MGLRRNLDVDDPSWTRDGRRKDCRVVSGTLPTWTSTWTEVPDTRSTRVPPDHNRVSETSVLLPPSQTTEEDRTCTGGPDPTLSYGSRRPGIRQHYCSSPSPTSPGDPSTWNPCQGPDPSASLTCRIVGPHGRRELPLYPPKNIPSPHRLEPIFPRLASGLLPPLTRLRRGHRPGERGQTGHPEGVQGSQTGVKPRNLNSLRCTRTSDHPRSR